jgi:hypothetical protein
MFDLHQQHPMAVLFKWIILLGHVHFPLKDTACLAWFVNVVLIRLRVKLIQTDCLNQCKITQAPNKCNSVVFSQMTCDLFSLRVGAAANNNNNNGGQYAPVRFSVARRHTRTADCSDGKAKLCPSNGFTYYENTGACTGGGATTGGPTTPGTGTTASTTGAPTAGK